MRSKRIAWVAATAVTAAVVLVLSQMRDTLIVVAPTLVLEKSWPLNYPSSDPLPNTVLRHLSPGTRIPIEETSYEKDYRVFEVRVGRVRGYVIDDSSVAVQYWEERLMARFRDRR